MYCQYCHAPLQQGTAACPSCGAPVPPPHLLALSQDKAEQLKRTDPRNPPSSPFLAPGKNPPGIQQPTPLPDPLRTADLDTTRQSAFIFPQIPAPTIPYEDEQVHARDKQIIESPTQKVSSLPGLLPDPITPLPTPTAAEASSVATANAADPMTHKTSKQKSNKLQLTVSIITLIAVSALLGATLFVAYHKYMGNTTINAARTTSQPGAVGPSGKRINPTISSIFSDIKTATAINSDYTPTQQATAFRVDQTIYLTFHIDASAQNGYLQAKWYQNGQLMSTQQFAHTQQNTNGYFSASYPQAGQGNTELYWCHEANCHDAELAQIVTFTVTGLPPTPTPPLTSSTSTAKIQPTEKQTIIEQ